MYIVNLLYSRILFLVKRGTTDYLYIIVAYFTIILVKRLFKKTNNRKITIVFSVIMFFLLWYNCYAWYPIRPMKLVFSSNTHDYVFRTADNKQTNEVLWTADNKLIPPGIWYPVERKHNDEFIQKVMEEYINEGGEFDFDTYSYIISFGFSVMGLYENVFPNDHHCIAVLGYDCEPDQVLIYQLPHSTIWFWTVEDRRHGTPNLFK